MSRKNGSEVDPKTLEKVELRGYVDSRLRDIVAQMADEQNLPMSEIVAKLLAQAVKRPDLAKVPRKPFGAPRRKAEA